MPTPVSPYAVAKHTLTLLDTLYAAAKKSATMQGLEVNELIVNLLVEVTARDGTLDELTRMHFRISRELIDEVVRVARLLCREGKFSENITRDAIRECTENGQWRGAYKILVQDDIYKHGNPLKVINREFGFRVRAGIGGTVKKDAEGRPQNAKVSGMIIQSYTLMESFDPAKVRLVDRAQECPNSREGT